MFLTWLITFATQVARMGNQGEYLRIERTKQALKCVAKCDIPIAGLKLVPAVMAKSCVSAASAQTHSVKATVAFGEGDSEQVVQFRINPQINIPKMEPNAHASTKLEWTTTHSSFPFWIITREYEDSKVSNCTVVTASCNSVMTYGFGEFEILEEDPPVVDVCSVQLPIMTNHMVISKGEELKVFVPKLKKVVKDKPKDTWYEEEKKAQAKLKTKSK